MIVHGSKLRTAPAISVRVWQSDRSGDYFCLL